MRQLYCFLALFTLSLLFTFPQAKAISSVEIISELKDGWLRGVSDADAWNMTTASNKYNVTNGLWIGQNYDTYQEREEIYRGYLYFDTSVISTDSEIKSVSLRLFYAVNASEIDFNVVVQPPNVEHPTISDLQKSDFWQGYYTGAVGSISTISIEEYTEASLIEIVLNDTSVINKGGLTRLVLRSDRDIQAYVPSQKEYIVFDDHSPGTPDGFEPTLIISYEQDGGASGPTDSEWIPINLPNLPFHARRVLEWVQKMICEHDELRAVVGLGLIMVIGGIIVKWDKKGKQRSA